MNLRTSLIFYIYVVFMTMPPVCPAAIISGPVAALLAEPDGNILVAGQFNEESSLVRLNSEGIVDLSFTPQLKNSSISALALQSDNKIYVGGYFGGSSSFPQCQGLIRLEKDGSIDQSFCQNAAEGFNSRVETLAVQADGKLVVGGSFSQYGSHKAQSLARVEANGSLDMAFQANVGDAISSLAFVKSVAIQKDGKILVLGNFQRFRGKPTEGLVRLYPDGSEETEFSEQVNQGLFTGFTTADSDEEVAGLGVFLSKVMVQDDGKILLSGEFVVHDEQDNVYKLRLIRLEESGAIDLSFIKNVAYVNFETDINTFAVLPDQKIVVGSNRPFACLNNDGTLDPACFTVAKKSFSGGIGAILLQNDGRLMVGGYFGQYRGVKVSNLIRLNVDGTLDETFMMEE